MKNVYEIPALYGGITTKPCNLFVYKNRNGSSWYCVEGDTIVNCTDDEIKEGTWIEELSDFDCFTVNNPINDIDEFIEAVES